MLIKLDERTYINSSLIEDITIKPQTETWRTGDYAATYRRSYYAVEATMSSGKIRTFEFKTEQEAKDFIFTLNHGKVE